MEVSAPRGQLHLRAAEQQEQCWGPAVQQQLAGHTPTTPTVPGQEHVAAAAEATSPAVPAERAVVAEVARAGVSWAAQLERSRVNGNNSAAEPTTCSTLYSRACFCMENFVKIVVILIFPVLLVSFSLHSHKLELLHHLRSLSQKSKPYGGAGLGFLHGQRRATKSTAQEMPPRSRRWK